jgi:hypothetical protein
MKKNKRMKSLDEKNSSKLWMKPSNQMKIENKIEKQFQNKFLQSKK